MKILRNAGIFLIPFSIFYCYVIEFFTMIGPWMFCFGIFLFAMSQVLRLFNGKLSDAVQIIIIVFPFVALTSYSLFIRRPYRQIIVVPENYEGMLTINYAVDTAKEVEYDRFAPVVYVGDRHIIYVPYQPFKLRDISIDGIEVYQGSLKGKSIPIFFDGYNKSVYGMYYVDCSSEKCRFVITREYLKYFREKGFNDLIKNDKN